MIRCKATLADSYALLRKMLEVGNGLESNGKRVNMVDVLLLIPFNISIPAGKLKKILENDCFNRKFNRKTMGKTMENTVEISMQMFFSFPPWLGPKMNERSNGQFFPWFFFLKKTIFAEKNWRKLKKKTFFPQVWNHVTTSDAPSSKLFLWALEFKWDEFSFVETTISCQPASSLENCSTVLGS